MGMPPFGHKKSLSQFDREESMAMGSAAFVNLGIYDRENPPNPDPDNYKIVKSEKIGRFLILLVNYPDCTNYEGNKILVFENAELEDIVRQGTIDPHFSENPNYYSPIARFKPTEKGWTHAHEYVKMASQRISSRDDRRTVKEAIYSQEDTMWRV